MPIQVVDDDLLETIESFFVSIHPITFDITVLANRSFANVLIADNEGTNLLHTSWFEALCHQQPLTINMHTRVYKHNVYDNVLYVTK